MHQHARNRGAFDIDDARLAYKQAQQTADKPLAAPGLVSYRYRGRYGWIMIGARDNADALTQAQRSTADAVTVDRLEIWDGQAYKPAV